MGKQMKQCFNGLLMGQAPIDYPNTESHEQNTFSIKLFKVDIMAKIWLTNFYTEIDIMGY